MMVVGGVFVTTQTALANVIILKVLIIRYIINSVARKKAILADAYMRVGGRSLCRDIRSSMAIAIH